MINFRYHLISIVAVFLALGIGILMGSTVIDQGLVDRLERNLDTLRDRNRAQDRRIGALEDEVDSWDTFAEQAENQLLLGRLRDVPVLVVAVDGIDRDPVESLHRWLGDAGAKDHGTLWLTGKLGLANASDVAALGEAIGAEATRPDAVRRAALAQLAQALAEPATVVPSGATLAGDPQPSVVEALRGAGFVEYEAPAGGAADLTFPGGGTRVVVVSGRGAVVSDGALALPLCRLLVETPGAAVLAAEAGVAAADPDSPGFVRTLREDDEVGPRLSTVDNIEGFTGQVAALLALEDLASNTVGHFGTGPGAERLLPAPNE